MNCPLCDTNSSYRRRPGFDIHGRTTYEVQCDACGATCIVTVKVAPDRIPAHIQRQADAAKRVVDDDDDGPPVPDRERFGSD
jgi:hypothetical protein